MTRAFGNHTLSIARYGVSKYLDACLASIKAKTAVPHEVFVTDTKEPRISIAAAWNKGLRQGSGEFCTVLNDDVLVSRGWLKQLEDALCDGIGKTGVVSPTLSVCANNQKEPYRILAQGRSPDGFSQSDVDVLAEKIAVNYKGQKQILFGLCGACLTFRRAMFEGLDGFDEAFFPIYGEDDDFCDRVIEIGFKCVWVKDVYVHHFGRKTGLFVPDLNRSRTSNLLVKKRQERANSKTQRRAN